MNTTIITLVGASLFLNYQKKWDGITKYYRPIQDRALDDWEDFEGEREEIANRVTSRAKREMRKASAEVTSILRILEDDPRDLVVYLLASDTIVSRLAAEILQKLFQEFPQHRGHRIDVRFDLAENIIPGLQVTNETEFQERGMPNLIHRIEAIRANHSNDVLLNITGGFKATIPYLTLMGNLYDMPLYYTFEDTETLLTIPKLPVAFDQKLAQKYAPYLNDVSRVESAPDGIERELRQTYQFVHKSDRGYVLTILGMLYKKFITREDVVNPHQ